MDSWRTVRGLLDLRLALDRHADAFACPHACRARTPRRVGLSTRKETFSETFALWPPSPACRDASQRRQVLALDAGLRAGIPVVRERGPVGVPRLRDRRPPLLGQRLWPPSECRARARRRLER